MPFKSESLHIAHTEFDRRIKLNDFDKQNIIGLYKHAGESINQLARLFNVNKRTIQFILFPERLAHNRELRLLRGGSKIYYNKDSHNDSVKRMRRYKQQLFKEGKI